MNHSLTRTKNRFFKASLESEYLSFKLFQVTEQQWVKFYHLAAKITSILAAIYIV